jgi:anaerobic selenocysteine-containing dehydrogenase
MGLREGEHAHTLFRALGALELDETICASAGKAAWESGYGQGCLGVDPADVARARLILLWGINSLSTHSHLTPWLTQARKAGAEIVHIDPYYNKTSRFADRHLAIRPGTDAALALGMMQQIFSEGLEDRAYLAEATEGEGELRAAAAQWDLDRTEAVTGLPAEQIASLARDYAVARPAFIRLGYGMTRHQQGGSALRAVSLLPAVCGHWRSVGGGATLSTSGAFALNRRHLGGRHLLRPGAIHVNMNRLATALEPAGGVRALFVYNSNPAVVAPDTNRVRAGMAREDLLTVVLEQAMTETAQLADYVLPATTFLEHEDLYTSYGHHYLSYNQAALPPLGEARPNSWIFAELGRRLGVTEPTLYWELPALMEDLLDSAHPHLAGVTSERLRREGSLRLSLPSPFLPYAAGAPTCSGRVHLAPAPAYLESYPTTEDFPYLLLTPPAHHFLNSTYGMVEQLAAQERGRPDVWMHPEDALPAGLRDGQIVLIRSRRGQVTRPLRLTEETPRGVLVAEGTWWGSFSQDGLPINALTSELLTDLGAGSTFHDTPVAVSSLLADISPLP